MWDDPTGSLYIDTRIDVLPEKPDIIAISRWSRLNNKKPNSGIVIFDINFKKVLWHKKNKLLL